MVHIRHQEEYIKPKKILPKIEFDSECLRLADGNCLLWEAA